MILKIRDQDEVKQIRLINATRSRQNTRLICCRKKYERIRTCLLNKAWNLQKSKCIQWGKFWHLYWQNKNQISERNNQRSVLLQTWAHWSTHFLSIVDGFRQVTEGSQRRKWIYDKHFHDSASLVMPVIVLPHSLLTKIPYSSFLVGLKCYLFPETFLDHSLVCESRLP